MICSFCATDLPSGALFCGECGHGVSSKPAAESARQLRQESPAQSCPECATSFEPADIFCGECGAVRIVTPAALPAVLPTAAPSAIARTAPLDPFPWGLPPGSVEIDLESPILPEPELIGASAAASAAAAGATNAAAAAPVVSDRKAEPDLEQTPAVGREPAGARFVLQFSTGESVSLSGSGILGRNPTPEPGEYFDSIVTIVDLGRSVSKTHLEFGQEAGSFWLSDRYSGNGTVVREPEQAPVRCEAGKRYFVLRGSRIDIGEQFFVVS